MGQRRWWTAAAVGLLQVVVLGSIVLIGTSSTPHDAPVAVVADPAVVAGAISQSADIADGELDVRSETSLASARAGVADGSLVAAVVVDLRVEQDTVLMASANGDDLNHAVLRMLQEVESSFGRQAVVQDVVPARAGDRDAWGVYVIVGLCVLLGFVGPIVITWLRGPVAPTLARGVARLAIVGTSAIIAGLVVGVVAAARYDDGLPRWWLIASLTLLASASVTLALESLFGVLGIGVAAAVLVLSAAPMSHLTSPLMLSEPWVWVTAWLPHGAALDAARGHAYFGGGDPQSLQVLAAWIILAILVLAVSRRERARDGATGTATDAASSVDP